MGSILESRNYGLWVGKQTAKGTPNTAPGKRLVQVAGGFAFPPDLGSEPYSDGTKYGNQTDWVNNLVGNGEPGNEATPTELAYLLWLAHGAETVTAVTGPPAASKHRFVPSTGRGFWATFLSRVGLTVVQRHQHNDCLISRTQIEGSTANKAVRVTPRIISLDPGQIPNPNADPAAGMPTDAPFLFTDGTGTFALDGTPFPAQSQFTLVIDEDLSPVYGDDTNPLEVVSGNAVVTIGVTLVFDSQTLGQWNKLVYGSTNPAAGTKPLKSVTPIGSYAFDLKQRDSAGALNGREFKLDMPAVRWTIPDAPDANPAGGSSEISLAGTMRQPAGGGAPYTIDVFTDPAAVAFTV